MRIGLVSDVHANLPALKVVLEGLTKEGCESFYCAGDVVGYNPWPNEVIAELRKRDVHCIGGNHDRAAVQRDDEFMNPYASRAILWTADALTAESKAWLRALPQTLREALPGGKVLAICHGAPDDPDRYVLPGEVDESLLHMAEADVLVYGHTHLPVVRKFQRGLVVNPGGVGQPRDGDPRTSAAVLDVTHATMDARIVRYEYDVESVAKTILEKGLPEVLARRLYSGW